MRRAIGLWTLLLFAIGSTAEADIVRLTGGRTFRGEIVRQDEKSLTLHMASGMTVTFPRAEVVSVQMEDGPRNVAAKAETLTRDGKLDEALAALEDGLRQFPGSARITDALVAACRLKAAEHRAAGRALEAEKLYRRILELSPRDDDAVEEVRKADAARADAGAAAREARLLVSFGREREALDLFAEIEALTPGATEACRADVAMAHALYGRRLLEFQRLDEAKRRFDLALKLDTKLLDAFRHEIFVARFGVLVRDMNANGRTFTTERWEASLQGFLALTSLEKDSLQLRYAIAVCRHELRRFAEAAADYAAIAGEPFDPDKAEEQVSALQALALEKARKAPVVLVFPDHRFDATLPGPMRTLETDHFTIHHHNDELAALVARASEYYLERNWRLFADCMPAKPWPKKCDIYLFRTREEYLRKSGQEEWSTALATSRAIDGVLDRHSIMTYQTVDDLLASELPHEITHIIHGAVVNYSGAVPSWLREGVAVRQEPWYKRLRMAVAIKEAREKKTLFSLDDILSQKRYPPGESVKLFYAQSYALVGALQHSGTKSQFATFCRIAQTTPIVEAVKQLYEIDADELKRRWEQHEDDLISLLSTP